MNIEQHHHDWSDLPEFPQGQLVSDEDVAAWSDLQHMREVAEQILWLVCGDQDLRIPDPGLIEYRIDVYLPPWPHDIAGDMLTAWRDGTNRMVIG